MEGEHRPDGTGCGAVAPVATGVIEVERGIDVAIDVDPVVTGTVGTIDTNRWRDLATVVLADLGVRTPAELAIRFVTPDTIGDLNGRYMGRSAPTDVLSFPLDGLGYRSPAPADPAPITMVGDVVVCPEVAMANAADHAGSLDAELALLLVHALLHLVGHDHAEADERTVMWAEERRLLREHFGPLPRDPWNREPS
ncbi:MAG: rRNA maturation RNase YbeY [Microthrixaceae bacterium]